MIHGRKTEIDENHPWSGCGVANFSTTLRNNGDEVFIPAWWPTGRAQQLQRITRSWNELGSAISTTLEGYCVASFK